MSKPRVKLGNGVIAILLACLTAILLTVTAPAIGMTWDEPNYVAAAESYTGWFGELFKNPAEAFKPQTIDTYWSSNHEHPPLDKVWSGLVWSATHKFFDDLTAHRLGNMLLVAFLAAFLYLIVAESFGISAGLFAVGALLSMPRFFFHAHLAALDVPVAVAIFLVTFLFWRTIDRKEWWWGLVLGAAWGLAEACKLNATFLPIGLFVWFLIFRRKWYLVLRFALMGGAAVLTFLLVWPWLYHQTWSRLLDYANFHLDHFKIGQWYLGQYYVPPPWHFVFVILWAVIPMTILLVILAGIVRARKGKQDHGLIWLLVISAVVPLLPFAVGKSLAYDNDRLFMPTYPFLAALAGIGFGWILLGLRKFVEQIKMPVLYVPVSLLLAIGLFLPQVVTMAGLYPHLLSYYSEDVGGLPGATRLGLETTYWCESYASALPYINAHAKAGDVIWVEPWSYDILTYYQLHGQLRGDVHVLSTVPGVPSLFGPAAPQPAYGSFYSASWFIYQYRQSQDGEWGGEYTYLVDYLKTLEPPAYQVSYQGIPIMKLYHR